MPPRWWRQPIPSVSPAADAFGSDEPVSLRRFLRAKRGFHRGILIACFAGSLLVPLAMHWLDASFGAGGGWAAVAEFADIRARFHLPWWLLAWLVPVAYTAVVALALLLGESLLYALRLDRGDHAWSSLEWSVRGWRAALAWAPAIAVLLAGLAVASNALGTGVDDLDAVFSTMASMLAGFFVLNLPYLTATKPHVLAPPRWPGALPVVVQLVVALLASIAPGWLEEAVREPSAWLLVPLALFDGFLALFALVLWLDPRRPKAGANILDAVRTSLRPGVFLPMLVLVLRWIAIFALLLLPVLPIGALLAGIVPMFANQLNCCWTGPVPWLVLASRFTLMWWWLVLMLYWAFVLSAQFWLAMLSSGRLLVELGAVALASTEALEATS